MDFLIPIFNTLVIAVATLLLMVGLMSAPWQVLLLILVLGVLASKWLIRRSQLQEVMEDIEGLTPSQAAAEAAGSLQPEHELQHEQPLDAATLSYRGASYAPKFTDNQPPSTDNEGASGNSVSGKYRGGIWTA